MADTPLHQLDGHDAAFLYSDTARANANVSLLHIYDQSTVPGGRLRFKTIDDPFERLRHTRACTARSDTVARAVGARELSTLARHTPAATLALTSKMLARLALGIGRRAPLANWTITNVPGPARPQYLCGARMTYFSAIMPISDGLGLVFAVTSYDGQVIVSPTSCRELMPDPEVFAQCVRDSFQELLARSANKRQSAVRSGRDPQRRLLSATADWAVPSRTRKRAGQGPLASRARAGMTR